jgi:hypothetical protein
MTHVNSLRSTTIPPGAAQHIRRQSRGAGVQGGYAGGGLEASLINIMPTQKRSGGL